MTKAEEAALKAYPKDIQLFVESQEEPGKWLPVDENLQLRYGYKRGYEQAEKDLALTWEDIADIDELITEVSNSYAVGNFDYDGELETFYEEVLRRFKQFKEAKK